MGVDALSSSPLPSFPRANGVHKCARFCFPSPVVMLFPSGNVVSIKFYPAHPVLPVYVCGRDTLASFPSGIARRDQLVPERTRQAQPLAASKFPKFLRDL